jgi:hypothetical protein
MRGLGSHTCKYRSFLGFLASEEPSKVGKWVSSLCEMARVRWLFCFINQYKWLTPSLQLENFTTDYWRISRATLNWDIPWCYDLHGMNICSWYTNRRIRQTQLQYYIKIHIGGGYMFRASKRPSSGHLWINNSIKPKTWNASTLWDPMWLYKGGYG